MIKTDETKLKPGTYFEQVPLEVVKKVVDAVTLEPSSEKTEPYSMPAGSLRLIAPTGGPDDDPSGR